jgi:SAM-dependent methyltransferase
MDISFQALLQARKKLGDSGIYILADMTEIPIQDDAIDAAISLHTVYHIHRDLQEKAIRELHRVIRPGSKAVIVYSWGWHSLFMNIAILPLRVVRAIRRIIRILTRNLVRRRIIKKSAGLYFYTHNRKWLVKQNLPFRVEIRVWRSLHTDFLKLYAHRALFGKRLLRWIWNLEEKYPRTMGRIGAFPMFILHK